jgi:hypothetical protein
VGVLEEATLLPSRKKSKSQILENGKRVEQRIEGKCEESADGQKKRCEQVSRRYSVDGNEG